MARTQLRQTRLRLQRLRMPPRRVWGHRVGGHRVGATPAVATPDQSQSCAGVSFTRNLKYGDSDQNVLDVATSDSNKTSARPVLVFVAGESFAAGATDAAGPLRDEVVCFAARHGMVGVKVNYRLAPANPWPAGAKDVAAAILWVHENIDLF